MLTKEEAIVGGHDSAYLSMRFITATLEDKELGYGDFLNYGIRYEPILIGLEKTMPKAYMVLLD